MEKSAIAQFKVGQKASSVKTVIEPDVFLFAEVTGDHNPIHLDEEYAKTTIFKERIAHGMLSAGYISAVLGNQLPGPGNIYMSQSLKFLAPVRFGDTITTTVEIIEIIPEKSRIVLKTTCTNQEGITVVDGEALAKML